MRNLVLVLIALIEVATFIRAFELQDDQNTEDTMNTALETVLDS